MVRFKYQAAIPQPSLSDLRLSGVLLETGPTGQGQPLGVNWAKRFHGVQRECCSQSRADGGDRGHRWRWEVGRCDGIALLSSLENV